MKYEDFISECRKLAPHQFETTGIDSHQRYSYRKNERQRIFGEDHANFKDIEYMLSVEWEVGGMHGGNCWDNRSPSAYISSNPPEDLTELDNILEKFRPTLTFLQYRKLTNELVEKESRTENEYYGNSTSYSSKQIDLEKLYNYMKEQQWFSDEK